MFALGTFPSGFTGIGSQQRTNPAIGLHLRQGLIEFLKDFQGGGIAQIGRYANMILIIGNSLFSHDKKIRVEPRFQRIKPDQITVSGKYPGINSSQMYQTQSLLMAVILKERQAVPFTRKITGIITAPGDADPVIGKIFILIELNRGLRRIDENHTIGEHRFRKQEVEFPLRRAGKGRDDTLSLLCFL